LRQLEHLLSDYGELATTSHIVIFANALKLGNKFFRIRRFGAKRLSCGPSSKEEDCEISMKTLEDILAQHPFWNNLPPQYFPLLIECAVIERFQPGEQIFKTGYDADHFYLIRQGKVALETAYVPGEGFITIQTLGAGEALGWSWLFPPHKWHFSARAVEPTEAVVFKANALRNKAKEIPAFGYDLAMRVGGIMMKQLQSTRIRLLDIVSQ
jgi:CRP/FNR family transcriptional regulator, cyclic AMP receptor protein